MQKAHAAFQADHCQPEKLYDFLHQLNQSSVPEFTIEAEILYRAHWWQRVVSPEFNVLLEKLKSSKEVGLFSEQIVNVKVRCRNFLLNFLNELKKKIITPQNII